MPDEHGIRIEATLLESTSPSEYARFHDDRAGGYLEPHTFRTDVCVDPDPSGKGDDDSLVFDSGLP